ncbi:MAG: WecB/TagA/CpsF family glycosyltransferase [Puia sp.]|nr:WecB/TagA/CpsF family glycosyltransferase [Puia sp.]
MKEADHFRQILGIKFFVGCEHEIIDKILRDGGLVVVPSGPGLKTLPYDEQYRRALLGSDFAIADSSLMVLLWNVIQKEHIRKLSGLTYLRALIKRTEFREQGASFWVMPTSDAARRNTGWLSEEGIHVVQEDVYLAPMYKGEIVDQELLRLLEERRPRHILLGVGGGIQEPLGFYLKEHLSYRPAIHCIGAAIAFLTGDQVRIPAWADRFGLGWLWRCLSNPRRYIPRYWEARHLAPLMFRYRDRLPSV